MAEVSDLRALARQRAALIITARGTLAGAYDRGTVAPSHPIGDATMRHLRQDASRIVARVSHGDATTATDDGRTCRTVAPPIACDNANSCCSYARQTTRGSTAGGKPTAGAFLVAPGRLSGGR